jgi:hypothetical protein
MRSLSTASVATILACLIVTAAAAARPYAPKMSCRSLQSMMAARGAVVVSTGPDLYDRFVKDSRYCERTQRTEAAWIKSADNPECFIGYTCREYMRDDW